MCQMLEQEKDRALVGEMLCLPTVPGFGWCDKRATPESLLSPGALLVEMLQQALHPQPPEYTHSSQGGQVCFPPA